MQHCTAVPPPELSDHESILSTGNDYNPDPNEDLGTCLTLSL